MRTVSTLAALTATLAISGGLAACSSSPPKAATPRSFTDSGGYSCASEDAQKAGGLCPENPLMSAEPSANPTVFTDPNGQTCAPSDEDNAGYCPGDDPEASGGDSGSAPAPTMTKQTDRVVFKVRAAVTRPSSTAPTVTTTPPKAATGRWATVMSCPGRRP
jgi:hypothetical protein